MLQICIHSNCEIVNRLYSINSVARPHLGPIVFVFMQFSTKILSNNRVSPQTQELNYIVEQPNPLIKSQS